MTQANTTQKNGISEAAGESSPAAFFWIGSNSSRPPYRLPLPSAQPGFAPAPGSAAHPRHPVWNCESGPDPVSREKLLDFLDGRRGAIFRRETAPRLLPRSPGVVLNLWQAIDQRRLS